ncbi:MAG: hypothetical protein MJZ70_09005, partial [Bacteroidales bacterium]|nr:hypothetical protein [Bacteroidales bacterium]
DNHKIGFAEGLEKGMEKGLKEGMVKGMEKGREEGRQRLLETARNLLRMGIPLDDVAQATGLSVEELQPLL